MERVDGMSNEGNRNNDVLEEFIKRIYKIHRKIFEIKHKSKKVSYFRASPWKPSFP